MFSRLQAAIPILTEEIHIDGWVKKIFPWKTNSGHLADTPPDNRECYRLDMQNLPPLDATLVSQGGAIFDLKVLNLSASGLSCRIPKVEPVFRDQVFTLVFALPLEEPVLIKTEAYLISSNPTESGNSEVLHLQFSGNLDSRQRDLIHGFIVKKQFDMIKQLRRGGCIGTDC
ncbi:MAG: hypothetical protein NPINA01_22610 [Nitrospinaceae bacterium]|nr:MAG: hypothetical protein NPINA01_22610 [Nitrospinaceae bacterium]